MRLQDFIADQIRVRGISGREFARLVGVAQPTIVRAMYEDAPEPTLDFLVKLARASGVSVTSLVAMCVPDDVVTDAEALALAEQIKNLPPEKREMVEALVRGYLSKS